MRKRWISVLLLLCVLTTMIPADAVAVARDYVQNALTAKAAQTEQTAQTVQNAGIDQGADTKKDNPFKDILNGDWYYEAVLYAQEKGFFTGTSATMFTPDGSMTRGMFVTVLGRMAGVDPEDYKGTSGFSDVPLDAYYAPYAAWAAKHGIAKGLGDGRFDPNGLIDRQQLATFFVRYFERFDVDYDTGANISTIPADLDSVAAFAKDAVLKLWRTGLLNGDGHSFNPTGKATRAQTAMLCMRTDETVETWFSEPGVTNVEAKKEEPESTGGLLNYVVSFETNGGGTISNRLLPYGAEFKNLPIPYKQESIFLGWCYDEALNKPVNSTDRISGGLTLYAKYQETAALQEAETPSSASVLEQGAGYTIGVLSSNTDLTAEEVRAAITAKNFNAPDENCILVSGSNGTYTISGQHNSEAGFQEGATFKITLEDSALTFSGYGESVRVFNFTTAKAEVLNLGISDKVKYIPFDLSTVSNLSGAAFDGMFGLTEGTLQTNAVTGYFTYTGNVALNVGDTVAIYEGERPDLRTLESKGDVAYLEITSKSGNTYGYEAAKAEDTLFTPDILPVPLNADTDGSAANNSITVEKSVMTYTEDIYANLSLDSQTTIEKGDYIAFYTGTFGQAGATDQGYARIISVVVDEDTYVIAYEKATQDEILAAMDLYNNSQVSGEEMLQGVDQAALENAVEQQAVESGFVDEAADYLTAMALSTDGFTDLSDQYKLLDSSVSYSDAMLMSEEQLELMGAKVDVEISKVQATLSKNLVHFSGLSGVRLTLTIGITIEITLNDNIKLVIDLEGMFEQEVRIKLNVSGGAVWKWWGIFPYIAEYQATANMDLYTFTGIGIKATIVTKENTDSGWETKDDSLKDISEQMKKLVDTKDKYIGDGTGTVASSLEEKYAAMLENESDWVELYSKEFTKQENPLDPFSILVFAYEVKFVISANLNISLGCDFWYENAKRYSYTINVFGNSVTNDTIDLVESHYEFEFYVMGTAGLRAGISASIKLGLFSTKFASVGFIAEAGVYIRVWGYFYYQLSYRASTGIKTYYAGALYFELGIYLEISFEAQAFNGTFSFNPTLYENEWPLWSAGMRENIRDFAYEEDDAPEVSLKRQFRTAVLPDDLFTMKYMDMKTGLTEDEDGNPYEKLFDDAERFTIAMTNNAFVYNPANNTLTVTPSKNSQVEVSEMTITWNGAPLAFTSAPLQRKVSLRWDNYNDGYSIVFNSQGGSPVPMILKGFGARLTAPANPVKTGYVFDGWYTTDGNLYTIPETMPDVDIAVNARWAPATNTAYTVQYHLQNSKGTYELDSFARFTGTTDSTVMPMPKAIPGYVTPAAERLIVKPDGSAVLGYYYIRQSYTVTFNPGSAGGESIVNKIKYGAPVVSPTMSATGYAFTGWDSPIVSTMPARDLTYTAQWQASTNTPYRMEHYVQNPNGSGYALKAVLYGSGTTGENLTVDTMVSDAVLVAGGIKYDYTTVGGVKVTSATVVADGSLVIKLYYLREQYVVKWSVNGTDTVHTYYYGQTISSPEDPTRTGYTFAGWDSQVVASMGLANLHYTATWTAKSDTVYKVEHYQQNVSGIGYTLIDTENLSGTTESVALAVSKEYLNFHLNSNAAGTKVSGNIKPDGTLVLKLYYDRDKHTVTWNSMGGTAISSVKYLYGQTIVLPTAPAKVGYLFSSWTGYTANQTMGGGNLTFNATWTPVDGIAYTVEHYTQKFDSSYERTSTEQLTGTTEATVTAVVKSITGFTFDPNHAGNIRSGAVLPDGTLVLKLYYTRNSYTLTWVTDGNALTGSYTSGSTAYGRAITAPNPTRTGYTFSGWSGTVPAAMPANALTFEAQWTAKTDTAYTVKHIRQALDGSWPESGVLVESEAKTGTTAQNTTAAAITYEGFSAGSVTQSTIAPDGSTVVTIKYTRNRSVLSWVTNGNALTGSYTSGSVLYGTALTAPATPTRTGYTFASWSPEVPGKMPDNALTLTAQWTANKYDVTFALNYVGAAAGQSIKQTYDANYTLPVSPSRSGYVFLGWFTASEGGVEVSDNTKFAITEVQTLYAHWQAGVNTVYTVKHYQQNVNDENYTLVATDSKVGTTEGMTNAASNQYSGFTAQAFTQKTILGDGSTVLAIYYNRNQYTLSFNTDDGTSVASIQARFGASVTSPANPTKTGYTFSSWDQAIPQTMPAENRAFTAQWTVNLYSITFIDGNNAVTTITQDYGTSVTAPADPQKTGYTFKGWDMTIPSKMEAKDITIRAEWEINQYTITFMSDGGSAVGSITQNYGISITAPADPTKTGYTFTSWSPALPATMPAKDLTVTAQWQINSYTITFDVSGGTPVAPITANYDASVTAPENPTKTGYTFAGWSEPVPAKMPGKALTLTAQWTANTDTAYTVKHMRQALDGSWLESGVLLESESKTGTTAQNTAATARTYEGFTAGAITQSAIAPNGSTVVTIKYTRNRSVLNWVTAGNALSGSYTSGSVLYGAALTAPTSPTRTGYAFAGWSPEVPGVMPDNALTLTAQWTANEYDVTFALNYVGAVAGQTTKQTYNANYILPVSPSRNGYVFLGWFTASEGGVEVSDNTKVTITATQTLYAHWQAGENTGYTVQHYQQNIGDENYTLSATESKAGVTEALTNVTAIQYSGFTAQPFNQIAIQSDGSTVLAIYYNRNQYTLTFDPDGGTSVAAIQARFGVSVTAPANPTKTGHTFSSWDQTIPQTMPAENKNFTAQWTINHYTITFMDGANTVATITQDYGTSVTAPADPTKIGYTFDGWDTTIPDSIEDRNITIGAKWKINQYTITFMSDGGSELDSIIQDYDSSITAPINPTKTGYTFTSWSPALPGTMPAENLTVTAQWKINSYTITFDADGGTAVAPITANYGTLITAPTDPTKTGYTFAGWSEPVPATMPGNALTLEAQWTANTDTAYTVKHIRQALDGSWPESGVLLESESKTGTTAQNTAATARTYEGFTAGSITQSAITPNGSTAVTIKYSRNRSVLSWVTDGNALSGSYTNGSVLYGTTITSPTSPTRDGYTFAGWSPEVPTVMPDNALTLTAQWTANKYDVTFELNYAGAPVGQTIEQTYDAGYSLPNSPSRSGYVFLGWFTATEGGVEVSENTTVSITGAQTLYAQWQAGDNTGYTVKHYQQNIGDENYTLYATESKTGVTEALTNVTAKQYSGFTAQPFSQETIQSDGSAVLAIYYNRNQYTLTFDTDGGTSVSSIQARFGASVTSPEHPAKTGHTFSSWDQVIPQTMPAEDKTFKAQWTVNRYSIKFMDGENTVTTITQDYGTSVTAPADPTKIGYTFDGWDTTIPDRIEDRNITIGAKWKINQYTITFVSDGGSTVDSITQDFGSAITAPANPTKTGYTFTSWSPALPGTMPSNNLTVTAQWQVNSYTITFDANGGTAVAPITADFSTSVTAPANPTKTGYTFDGWDTTIPSTIEAKDITIRAKWKINQYTITFFSDGGSAVTPITQDYESAVTAPANPTKTGYTFTSWIPALPATMPAKDSTVTAQWKVNQYTVTFKNGDTTVATQSVNYSSTTSAPTAPTKTGYTFDRWFSGSTAYVFSTAVTGDLTLTASWTPNAYSVLFNANGGTGNMSEETGFVYDTSKALTANAFTRTGYTFAGWATSANGSVTYNNQASVSNLTATNGGTVTLYAKWTPVSYTISYTMNGGDVANPSSYTIESETFYLIQPTKTGYTFAGWTGSNGTTAQTNVSIAQGSSGGKSYTANWTAKTYTVTLISNSGTINAGDVTSYTYATGATLPTNVTREGYTFAGWYASSALTGTAVTAITSTDIENKTYYAKWTPVNYTITYNLGRKDASINNTTSYTIEQTITLANATTIATDVAFDGWYSDAALTTKAVNIPVGSSGAKTLYARWTTGGTFTLSASGNTFTISRSGINTAINTYYTGNNVNVYYRTLNGSAIGGTHFTHLNSYVTFGVSDTQKTVTVTENSVTSQYGSYAATMYSNADRVYFTEIYQVDGGGTLGTSTQTTRTMTKNSGYTIDASIYTNTYTLASDTGETQLSETYETGKSAMYSLTGSSLKSRFPTTEIQNYVYASGAKAKVWTKFDYRDKDWYTERFVQIGVSLSKFFSSNFNGDVHAVPEIGGGARFNADYGRRNSSGEYLTFSFPNFSLPSGYTLWATNWASGQDSSKQYVLFGVDELPMVSMVHYQKEILWDWGKTKNVYIYGKLHDVTEPTYLGLAPSSSNLFKIGETTTIALVFSEIVNSATDVTVKTNLSDTPFTLKGGIGTNILYFEGIVKKAATSVTVEALNNSGNILDLAN